MKEKTICLTFICKDNEDTIKRMIDSCLPLVDEIIACDTGSKDDTVKLIHKFKKNLPVTTYYHKWKNFGHNRTLMMQAAAKSKCDYILVMDSDEKMMHLESFDFKNMVGDVVMIKTVSGSMEYYRDRMFKNSHDWKWIGYAHEYPHSETFKLKQHAKSIQLELYPKHNSNHITRNYNLLQEEEKDGLATSRTYFYLGQSAKDLGLLNEALEYYMKCIGLAIWDQEKFFALYDIARINHQLNKFDIAQEYYLKAHEVLPERAEPLYNLAKCLREQELYNQALIYLKVALGIPIPSDGLFLEWAVYKYLIEFEMSICSYWTEDYMKALICSKKVKETITADKISDHGVEVQNLKNISYTRLKLIAQGNLDILIIELPEGYDGLGDHLLFSHIPELAKKKGFKEVLVSDHNKYKTAGTKEAVWETNPFVDGFIDERGTHFDAAQLFEILNGKPIVNNMPMLKQISMVYDVYDDDYNGLPILYMGERKSVFDNVQELVDLEMKKTREGKNKHLFYDGNWKHYAGIEQKDVDDYFLTNSEIYDLEYPVKYQAENLGSCLTAKVLGMDEWETGTLETYILRILACHRFICLMSGGSVVSAAIGKPCVVIDDKSSSKYYKFPQINFYLSDIPDA
jgi:glycosyltransferase involved in cell wall biosynthesis